METKWYKTFKNEDLKYWHEYEIWLAKTINENENLELFSAEYSKFDFTGFAIFKKNVSSPTITENVITYVSTEKRYSTENLREEHKIFFKYNGDVWFAISDGMNVVEKNYPDNLHNDIYTFLLSKNLIHF